MIDGFNLLPPAANSAGRWSVRITENGAVSFHRRKLPERRDNYIIAVPSIYIYHDYQLESKNCFD